ncbi:MAG: hypothetical protein Q9199_002364 [Rusavskia elegans]
MTFSSYHIWCKACDRDFVSEEARQTHWENNDVHLYSYCADCEWDYVDSEGLKNHERERHANRFCAKCDRSFDTEAARIAHTASKHKTSFCTDCEVAFDTSDALKQHWRSHEKHVGTYDFICDLRFPNRKTRTEHLNADPVKHFVCVQHQQFCGSQQALEAHYLKAHAKCAFCNLGFDSDQKRDHHYWACHARCLNCKLWFKDNALRNEHYMISISHVQCHQCKQGFEDEQQLARHHWNHHAQCLKCKLGFENDVQLNQHYKSSTLHFQCAVCNLGFPDEQERQRHYWGYHTTRCSLCKLGFENDTQLQQHYMTPDLHVRCYRCNKGFEDEEKRNHHYKSFHTSKCASCKLGFEDDAQLNQHYMTSHPLFQCQECFQAFDTTTALSQHKEEIHKPKPKPKPEVKFKPDVKPKPEIKPKPELKPLHCLPNCSSTTIFPSISAVMEHLEDGTCSKGWTIQHLNNLLVKLPTASPYIIWDHIAYFLAGPPRLQANDNDHTDRGWRCYLCRVPHLSPLDLQRHLQARECHTRYPDVVRCPHCPDAEWSFDRMSTLSRHRERRECGVDTNAVHGIVEDVKEEMSMNVDGRAEELKVLHQLRIDASKGGRDLIVKSWMNSK